MSTSTFDTIARILAKNFHVEPARIAPDAALADFDLDSLGLMEFVFAAEDAFQLRIPEDRLDPRMTGVTLRQLCDVIDSLRAEVPAAQ